MVIWYKRHIFCMQICSKDSIRVGFIWLYVYGYMYMVICIWLYVYGYMYMVICIWLYVYGYMYMVICIYGYMAIYT
jgi:hypothetical protein